MSRFSVFPALFWLLSACQLHAQLIEISLNEVVDHSSLVVEGRVIARQSFWDNAHHNIYTSNTVEVSRIFKGGAAVPATLEVITYGGTVDNRMDVVSESVQYRIGQVGVFCLMPCVLDLPISPVWENYGSPHGFFEYDLYTNTVQHPFHSFSAISQLETAVRKRTHEPVIQVAGKDIRLPIKDRLVPTILSFSPTTITAGTNSLLTINGNDFGASTGIVRFLNSNTGSVFNIDASDIVSWSNTQIVVTVPSTSSIGGTAGTGTVQIQTAGGEVATSSSALTVQFAHTNISSTPKYPIRLVDMNNAGGMTYTLSTSLCGANQDATNAIGRALREWRCVSGVNWTFATSASSSTAIAEDNINMITFDVSTPLTGGILGRATSRYIGCFSGGDFHWYVEEVDLNLDQATSWYFCDAPGSIPFTSFDFQSVVFHELGHGHQLSHIIDASAVMHRSISNNQIKRSLNANELAGANYVLGQTPNPCGPDPMSLLSAPACLTIALPATCNNAGVCTISLPVELVRFEGHPEEKGVLLTWATATEWNNHHFTLDRSSDAFQFSILTEVAGSANSTSLRAYEFLDKNPLPGLAYYRLRQTDFDGAETILGMVAVSSGIRSGAMQVYPNPVHSDQLMVHLDLEETDGVVEYLLNDMLGRQVLSQTGEASGQAIEIGLKEVPTGVYLLTARRRSDRWLLGQHLVIRQ
ncbi:MAG: IPT/TIG domain-containing protein [Saprospiraceae bacterium]|nr:IPT/TIG domain-containing protein [Saprospiraceae bacterium]